MYYALFASFSDGVGFDTSTLLLAGRSKGLPDMVILAGSR